MDIKAHIFRENDIRGVVDSELNDQFAYLLGRAYATFAKENNKNTIGIGWDCRLSSEGYAHCLARGLADEGVQAVLTGLGPTPQLYFAVFDRDFGGGIQVTGSHNPSDMNGFKIMLGKSTLTSEQISDLHQRMLKLHANGACLPNNLGTTDKFSEDLVRESYIQNLVENCKPHIGKRKIKIVVDAGNGVGGLVGPQILNQLGAEVVELYCNPDGRFPNHHPDPTVLENIEDLIAKVKETRADFGIGWDGDADRIGVVDQNGEVIFGDMLLLIYARSILKEKPGAIIVGDVKCSSLLFDDLKARGAHALMWKTGHSLIKKKLAELKGDLGGEMSGHIMFQHRFYGFDDALYCSARLLEIMSNYDGAISSLLADLPSMVATPEVRVDCAEELKFKIPELAKKAFANYEVDTTDGVRISFANGWGLVRASNTQPVLVMRFEATTKEALQDMQELVVGKIEEIKMQLTS